MKEKKPYDKRVFACFLGLAGFFLVADFVSKWLVQALLPFNEEVAVIPGFFYLFKDYNTGIAFSFGSDWPLGLRRGLNIAISVIMSVVIFVYWFKKRQSLNKWQHASASLLLGGAVGNLIDRACYWVPIENGGPFGVIDFCRFYIFGPSNKPFATFNIADACLVVGVAMLLVLIVIDMIKGSEAEYSKDPRKEGEETEKEEKKSDE